MQKLDVSSTEMERVHRTNHWQFTQFVST